MLQCAECTQLKDRGKELGHVDIYETADHK
jgi:hypothetical protein